MLIQKNIFYDEMKYVTAVAISSRKRNSVIILAEPHYVLPRRITARQAKGTTF